MYLNRPLTEHSVTGTERKSPSIAVVMPFEPKMARKGDLEIRNKSILARIEKELMANYPSEQVWPLIKKLQHSFKTLNYSTHKSSVALFLSPESAHTIYMDIAVNEKVVIDAPFCAKDIVDCKKDDMDYLVLLLSARQCKIYLSSAGELRIIKSNFPGGTDFYGQDVFLRRMDEGLTFILRAYPRPVFVVGDGRVTDHFSRLTRNEKNIVDYIHKSGLTGNVPELRECLQPYLDDWKEVRQQHALHLVEKAADTGRLAHGIEEVSGFAKFSSSRLLVVERNFRGPETACKPACPGSSGNPAGFYLNDPVDKAVSQVLANGSNVEWVNPGRLNQYGHIALIR